MTRLVLFLVASSGLLAADNAPPLAVFDNGLGRGILSIDDQVELARQTGYSGVLFAGTAHIEECVARSTGAVSSSWNLYRDESLRCAACVRSRAAEAIHQLRGSGAMIAFNINGKNPNGDAIAVRTIQQVADMAADSGLRVALYPHFGMYMARIEDALRLREKAARKNVGIVFNLCHWLRSGDEANLHLRLQQAAPYLSLVLINGADHAGDWDRLIQPLDRGEFDLAAFLKALKSVDYRGPIGLQCYAIKGDREENLRRSMTAWEKLTAR